MTETPLKGRICTTVTKRSTMWSLTRYDKTQFPTICNFNCPRKYCKTINIHYQCIACLALKFGDKVEEDSAVSLKFSTNTKPTLRTYRISVSSDQLWAERREGDDRARSGYGGDHDDGDAHARLSVWEAVAHLRQPTGPGMNSDIQSQVTLIN